jgi:hypothetical protein
MLSPAQIEARRRIEERSIPEPNSGCWLWLGCARPDGYGCLGFHGKLYLAHRLSYSVFCTEIPAGLQIDHLCRMRCCVNPGHLEPVTIAENLRRGIGQLPHDFCRRGHPMTIDNIVYDNNQIRRCAICSRAKNNAFYARKHHAYR